MASKLDGNTLWESSRMMLPEHRELFVEHRLELKKKQRPILDNQLIEEFVRTIAVSIFTEKPVRIKLFDEYNEKTVIGNIDKIDTEARQLKIKQSGEWIKLGDILTMELELE